MVLPLAGNTPRDLSLSPVLNGEPAMRLTRTALDTSPLVSSEDLADNPFTTIATDQGVTFCLLSPTGSRVGARQVLGQARPHRHVVARNKLGLSDSRFGP